MSHESGNEGTAGLLLDDEQRGICQQLTSAEAPHGGRAQALLALDEGATQAAAADSAGLTKGQVKYWLGRFRKIGLGIFPEDLVDQARPEAAPTPSAETDGPEDEEVHPVAEGDASQEDEVLEKPASDRSKAKKKSKKAKGKSKKERKSKKSTKEKKSKKKSKKKGKKKSKKTKKSKSKTGKKPKKKKKK